MSCEELRLEEFTVGDDILRAWEFNDTDLAGHVIGPSNLTDHTFESVIKYAPGDTVEYPFTMSVVGNVVYFEMLEAVTMNLPVGDLWWSLRETVGGLSRTIKRGRVLVLERIT